MPAIYLTHHIFNASVYPSVDYEGLYLIIISVNSTFGTDNKEVTASNLAIYEEIYFFDSISQALEECVELMGKISCNIGQN